jgi:hypothetical protein
MEIIDMCTHETPTQPNHIPVPISKAKRFNQRSATAKWIFKTSTDKKQGKWRARQNSSARWPSGFPAGVEQVSMPALVGYGGAIKK